MKPSSVVAAPTIDELRRFIHSALCANDRLDPDQSPLLQETIKRSGRTCGLLFQVQGPRRLKSYAIWAGEENRILFYDSAGLRIGETRLSDAPDPMDLAA
jgi:hypothetical protein